MVHAPCSCQSAAIQASLLSFLKHSSVLGPQGLCTCCSLCLECLSASNITSAQRPSLPPHSLFCFVFITLLTPWQYIIYVFVSFYQKSSIMGAGISLPCSLLYAQCLTPSLVYIRNKLNLFAEWKNASGSFYSSAASRQVTKLLRGTVAPGLALWCLPGLSTCASLGSWERGMHGKRQPQPAHPLPRPMCSGPGRRF